MHIKIRNTPDCQCCLNCKFKHDDDDFKCLFQLSLSKWIKVGNSLFAKQTRKDKLEFHGGTRLTAKLIQFIVKRTLICVVSLVPFHSIIIKTKTQMSTSRLAEDVRSVHH